jgi:hypothetical protein
MMTLGVEVLYHNAISFKGLEIHTYSLLANQKYARC